jgi:hypothetical protein
LGNFGTGKLGNRNSKISQFQNFKILCRKLYKYRRTACFNLLVSTTFIKCDATGSYFYPIANTSPAGNSIFAMQSKKPDKMTQSTTRLKGILAAAILLMPAGLCIFYIDCTWRFLDFASRMACQAAANASQYLHIVPLH